MKLYQINVVCGTGSTGRIVADISHMMEEHGDECRIAYGRGKAPDDINAIKVENKFGNSWHAIMTRLTDRHGLYSKRATKMLIKDIKQFRPDIIHLHNIHGYYLNYEMLFAFLKEYNKPVVWTLHDCWAFTGHCAHFDASGCQRWKMECGQCCQSKEYPSSLWKDASQANYTSKKKSFTGVMRLHIITVSDWLKSVAEQSFLTDYPIITIYNGIDLKVMHPTESNLRQQYELTQKKIVLGVASVWNEKKGLGLFQILAAKLPENYQIILIGVSEKLKKRMPANVICIDKQNYTELAKWYSAADVYVNGSIEETMGLTTIEAMACGTPVVVQRATAIPEVVGEGCGIVVKKHDIDGMIQAITTLEKTDEVTNRCVTWAAEFEKKKQYQHYYEVYQNLLTGMEK